MKSNDYYKSELWAKIAWAMRWLAGERCQVCNSRTGLQVHHRDYARFRHERPEDLIVLCEKCHAKHHNQMTEEELLWDEPDSKRTS